MTPEYYGKLLERLRDVAPAIIAQHFNVDSCIASTRIGIEPLRYFDIEAEPIVVNYPAAKDGGACHSKFRVWTNRWSAFHADRHGV